MVKQLRIAFAFLRLIRPVNLVIMGITQCFVRWFILKPLLLVSGFEVQLSSFQFALLVLSTMLIAAAGYIINDYFDRKTDLINRPGRVIVGRLIHRRYAIIFHILFTTLGIALGGILSHSIHRLGLTMVFIFAASILWLYSTLYKRQLVIGNLLISLLTGMVPLMVLLFEFPLLVSEYKLYVLAGSLKFDYLLFWIGSYAAFAFLVNLIREIIKDMEDFKGDYVFGMKTIPIVWGMKTARWLVISFISITLIPVIYLLVFHLNDKISFVYITFFIIVPFLMLAYGMFWADNKKQYHFLSQLAKGIMLTGLMYCPLVNYIISSHLKP